MVKPLPAGCRLTAIFDVGIISNIIWAHLFNFYLKSCHSGTAMGKIISAQLSGLELIFLFQIYLMS
jgi:uncharacterized membrane protein YccF (DUF307 family)